MAGRLKIHDSRTQETHYVTIQPGNYVNAAELSKVGQEGTTRAPGLRILDRGYEHTACMQSAITHIDGQRGAISFRGRPIQELFHNHDFEQVMHLLIWGDLPSTQRISEVRRIMAEAMQPPKLVTDIISAYPRDSPVYSMLLAGLSAYSSTSFVRESQNSLRPTFHGNLPNSDEALIKTLSYYASTVALVYCHREGKEMQQPDPSLSLVANLLHMMGRSSPELVELFSKLWILYADHEMTASTAAVLHTASTLADPLSSIVSGICAGYGPLHGGAINIAYEQLQRIGSPENIPIFMTAVKAKTTRLFGYGHRIYRARDPRLELIEELMDKYEAHVGDDPLLKIARHLEAAANNDEYFIKRNLRANADLKGCFLYTAFGFDTDIVTAIIGLSRVSGALAHWRESQQQSIKLWRPQQIYTGPVHEDMPEEELVIAHNMPLSDESGLVASIWNTMQSTIQTIVGVAVVSWYGFNRVGGLKATAPLGAKPLRL